MAYRLEAIFKSYGNEPVLSGIDLELAQVGICVVLGPSGCGKTTLLNVIAGLTCFESGRRLGFEGAHFSYAFQEPRLLPWLDARANITYALKGAGGNMEKAEQTVDILLEAAGLANAAHSLPSELSGGMRQRLSLVRAFAYPADILLLDEAFKAVDLRTKIELMDVFLELEKKEPRSVVAVTHDIEEAVYLADRVIVLSERPTKIIDTFKIDVPREDRTLGSPATMDAESRLYRLALGDRISSRH